MATKTEKTMTVTLSLTPSNIARLADLLASLTVKMKPSDPDHALLAEVWGALPYIDDQAGIDADAICGCCGDFLTAGEVRRCSACVAR